MYPDLLLHHGRIYTLNPAQPWAEALVCHQGHNEGGQPEMGWYPQERLVLPEVIRAYTLGPAEIPAVKVDLTL